MRRDDERGCTPDTCSYHRLTDSVIGDLKEAVTKLMEGQEQMRDTVIQLTEAFKVMDKIDQRLDKLEDLQRERDRLQDEKIQELRGFMYKSMGAVAGAGALIAVLLKFIGVG